MLAEFALEPELLSNWRDYRFYVGQFGVANGRLISRYPKKWKQMVIKAAQSASDVEYLRIEESLKNIEALLLPRIHTWDESQEWLPNAIVEHDQRPFDGILARTKLEGTDCVLCGDDIDPADPNPPQAWAIRKSIQIPRTPQDMAACVNILLRNCKQVLFVDPHYDPANRRHNQPLREFLAAIASREPQTALPTRIEYHTSNKNPNVADFTANLNRWVKPSLPARTQMTIVRWKVEELHNRYILTDRGGVMFGTGLDQDESLPPSEDTVTLLDTESCSELMVAYSSDTTTFTWLSEEIQVTS